MKTMWLALLILACGSTAPGGFLPDGGAAGGDGGAAADAGTGDGGTAVAVQGLDAVDATGEKLGVVLGLQQNGVLELWREDVQALMYVQMSTGFVTQPNPILYATATCGGSAFMTEFNGEAQLSETEPSCVDTGETSSGVSVLTAVGGSLTGTSLGSEVRIASGRPVNVTGLSWRPTTQRQGSSSSGATIPHAQLGQCATFIRSVQYCARETLATALATSYSTPLRLTSR